MAELDIGEHNRGQIQWESAEERAPRLKREEAAHAAELVREAADADARRRQQEADAFVIRWTKVAAMVVLAAIGLVALGVAFETGDATVRQLAGSFVTLILGGFVGYALGSKGGGGGGAAE